MLGSAVSSSTPKDSQPSSHIGQLGSCPLMNCHAFSPGPTQGCPYIAVGMQRALASLIGLPSRATSAHWMLGFLIPADVRRSFMRPPGVVAAGRDLWALTDPYAVETGRPQKLIGSGQIQPHVFRA